MKVISPLDGGGQEVILTLIQGGVQLYFKAYFANFRTPPPDNYCTVPNCEFLKLCQKVEKGLSSVLLHYLQENASNLTLIIMFPV